MSFALANLSINITANAAPARAALQDVGTQAQQSMRDSEVAVQGFQRQMVESGANTQRAAAQMGSSMDAAKTAIVDGSAQSADALSHLNKAANDASMQMGMAEKIAASFGTAFGASYTAAQTWIETTVQYVETKAKYMAIGLAVAAVSATAGVVYGAYRIISGTLGFIGGLFTGESYKDASIDKLIALNAEVQTLQSNLNISAQEAQALLDAMNRLGVNKSDITATYKATETAIRANADELDRLGVKYKEADGALLSTRQILANVKSTLDDYTDGWDRNAAAAAIGVGSYESIAAALKVTDAEIAASQQRLIDYQVVIGPNTQKAIEEYKQAMRDFNNETKLMGEGLSRVTADAIMPALTSLAVYFRDGWPQIIQAYRIGVSTFVGLGYALKNGIYIVAESILGSLESIGIAWIGLHLAIQQAAKGNFSAAGDALTAGATDALARFKGIGSNIVAQVIANDAAIRLAVGGGDDPVKGGIDFGKGNGWGGKKFEAKPAPAAAAPPEKTSAYQSYLDSLDVTIKKVTESEYASMHLRAEQLAQKEGITDLTRAEKLIAEVRAGDSAKAVAAYTEKLREQNAAIVWETSLLGKTTLEVATLTARHKEELGVQAAINSAKQAGKPLTDAAITQLRDEAKAAGDVAEANLKLRNSIERSAGFGSKKAWDDYVDNATNASANAKTMVTGSLTQIEDALVNFAKTGKLSFSSLFSFMAEEYLRQQIRMQMAKLDGGGGMGSLFMSGLSTVWGGFAGMFAPAGVPLASGTNNVPYDGFQATLHKGEAVVPAAYNPATGGAGGGQVIHIDFSGQTLNVGQGVSRGEVAAALKQQQASTVELIRRRDRTGRWA